MMKLKRLEIRALRGVRDWPLVLDGKSLVLWGENASGKSSVVDALEFLFTGEIKHLVGIRGLSLRQHGPHAYLGRALMQVTATFDPGAITVSRSLESEPTVPPVLKSLWNDASSGAFILRRSQLLVFIHNDPAERYRAIASMIGAESLDDIDLAMMRARDRAEGNCSAQKGEVEGIKKRLAELADGEPSTPHEALGSLNRAIGALGLAEISSFESVSSVAEDWLRSAKVSDQRAVASLQELRSAVDSATAPPELESELRAYCDGHSRLRSERQRLASVLEAELLALGEQILAADRLANCPLCEQPIDVEDTLCRVRARRERLQELSQEVSQLRKLQEKLLGSLKNLEGRVSGVASPLATVLGSDANEPAKAIQQFGSHSSAAIAAIEASTQFDQECNLEALICAVPAYQIMCSKLVEYADERQNELALTERDQSILSLVQRARDLARLGTDFDRENKKLELAEGFADRAGYVFETFSRCRKAEIKRIYGTIQDDISRFYDVLHPGELHGDLQLVLPEGRRASTELRIRAFGERDEDPRAFTSEGHLDSLGLCIFLAFVKQFAVDCPLVALDDVVMSIDSSHRGRVAELLLREFTDYQLIITTHDDIWLDELERHQRAFGADGRFVNLRILRWSLEEGPIVRSYRPRWQRIEDKLKEVDKTGAANDGRQYLEWILFEICAATKASVELEKDGRYDVGHLQDPARIRLKKLLPSHSAQIDGLFQEITAAGTPGNLLSHHNANAQSVSISEIERFCKAGRALSDWYECPSCGQIPKYIRALNMIRCSNRRCKSPKEWKTA